MPANVIKARALGSGDAPAVIKRNMLLANQDANEILAEAREEARRIVEDARRNAQSIFDSASEDGYRAGAGQWSEALADAWKSRDRYVAANEAALLKLAVRIAEKLLGEQLRIAPDSIASIVREATASMRRAERLVIQVHPEDATLLNEGIASLRTPVREVEVCSNSSLSRGDCIVESDIGVIDARLETQLQNLERALTASVAT
jgi:type III secretion system HrpE/YscL family protein